MYSSPQLSTATAGSRAPSVPSLSPDSASPYSATAPAAPSAPKSAAVGSYSVTSAWPKRTLPPLLPPTPRASCPSSSSSEKSAIRRGPSAAVPRDPPAPRLLQPRLPRRAAAPLLAFGADRGARLRRTRRTCGADAATSPAGSCVAEAGAAAGTASAALALRRGCGGRCATAGSAATGAAGAVCSEQVRLCFAGLHHVPVEVLTRSCQCGVPRQRALDDTAPRSIWSTRCVQARLQKHRTPCAM